MNTAIIHFAVHADTMINGKKGIPIIVPKYGQMGNNSPPKGRCPLF